MNNIQKTSILALVGLALASQSASAGLSWTGGEVLLGFRTGSTQELVFDLGNYTQFSLSGTFTPLDISADLTTAFGASWNTLNNISWGAVGTTTASGASTSIMIGKAEVTKGITVTGQNNLSEATSQKVFNALSDLNYYVNPNKLANYDTDTAYSNGYIAVPLDTTSPYWTNLIKGIATGYSPSFGVFDATTIEANNGATAAATLQNTAVDLFALNRSGSGTGAIQGTFTVSNAGVLSFTAVPEPSTYAMMAVGGIGFLSLLRRRAIKA